MFLPFSFVPRRLFRLARLLKQRLSGRLPVGYLLLLGTAIDAWSF
jgi:hypothetical protein